MSKKSQQREQERLARKTEKTIPEGGGHYPMAQTEARMVEGAQQEQRDLVDRLKGDGSPALQAVGERLDEAVGATGRAAHAPTPIVSEGNVIGPLHAEQPCSVCGQTGEPKGGEYPCRKCGRPTQHDEAQTHPASLRDLEDLMRLLTPHMRDGEAPRETLERVLLLAGTVTAMLKGEHPHAALLAVAQTGEKPERYDVVLLEKLADGSLGTVKGAEGAPWSEARDAASRLFYTRITPEQFRE